jgi:aspartyl-tRNA(Asn)/glutamyl-tRNA(Gln) amidotransferase subunit A
MKPSMGRVPLWPGCRDDRLPGISSWESLEHLGPLTRTVADAALMLSVLTGPDPRDRHSIPNDIDWMGCTRLELHGLRVAYSADLGRYAVDPEIRAALERAASLFATDLGCIVEKAEPALPPDLGETFAALEAMETDLVAMRRLYEPLRNTASPELLRVLDRHWTAEDFTSAIVGRKRLCRAIATFMQDYDLFLTPTLASLPFPLLQDHPDRIDGRAVGPDDWACFSAIANLTGQPAISLNMGWSATGLPIALQITGRHLNDACVLAAAARFEAICAQS